MQAIAQKCKPGFSKVCDGVMLRPVGPKHPRFGMLSPALSRLRRSDLGLFSMTVTTLLQILTLCYNAGRYLDLLEVFP